MWTFQSICRKHASEANVKVRAYLCFCLCQFCCLLEMRACNTPNLSENKYHEQPQTFSELNLLYRITRTQIRTDGQRNLYRLLRAKKNRLTDGIHCHYWSTDACLIRQRENSIFASALISKFGQGRNLFLRLIGLCEAIQSWMRLK